MFKFIRRQLTTKHKSRILELEAECDSLRRQLRVADAERQSMALVIARDRERVKAELAAYAKVTAGGEQ